GATVAPGCRGGKMRPRAASASVGGALSLGFMAFEHAFAQIRPRGYPVRMSVWRGSAGGGEVPRHGDSCREGPLSWSRIERILSGQSVGKLTPGYGVNGHRSKGNARANDAVDVAGT